MRGDSAEKPITERSATVWVVSLCLCALLLAATVAGAANDMYAFVKPEGEAVLRVTSTVDARELSERLSELGVVKSPAAFELYLYFKGKGERVPELAGEWTLNKNMSYREILLTLW